MILCVAGQSNAVGYDESRIPEGMTGRYRTGRLFQLGFWGEDDRRVVPLGPCAQNFQDMRPYGHPQDPGVGTRGIHLPLADLLLDHVPEDYDILVIPCAYGGTGFTCGEDGSYDPETMRPAPGIWRWGVTSCYYRAMCDRIRYALDLHPENRFLGMVWCQGEWDWQDAAGHWEGFRAMTDDFFRRMDRTHPGRVYRGGWDRSVWYDMETVAYWYSQGQCPQIWANYRQWSPETYVPIPRSTDSNLVGGTGLTAKLRQAHFGNDSFHRVIAPAVAEVMARRLGTARGADGSVES